ncbi:MAG: hypothetical protein HYX92_09665 [Chloroflexi bacterium]|nr:hypothetical protein [Chloroflexota bacterium]
MVAETDVLLNPVGEVDVQQLKLAPRLKSLEGTVGGFIDNHKVNSDVFLARLLELLKEKYGMAEAIMRTKPLSSVPAPQEIIDEMAAKCDFVVHAHAD